MSAGGHINDMVSRIRQNAALKVSRRDKFRGNNRKINFSKKVQPKPEYDFPKVSKSELDLIKSRIKEEALKKNKKQQIYLILFGMMVLLIFLIFN